jgi:hypothetical protein
VYRKAHVHVLNEVRRGARRLLGHPRENFRFVRPPPGADQENFFPVARGVSKKNVSASLRLALRAEMRRSVLDGYRLEWGLKRGAAAEVLRQLAVE